MRYVSFGGPIFLGVVGAILAFAVSDVALGPVDLGVVGVILLIAAVIWLVLSIVVNRPQKRTRIVRREPTDRRVVEERYDQRTAYDDPPTRRY